MDKNLEEKELIRGCIDRKEKYLEALYYRYQGKMLAVCRRYARDSDEAKDIMQEGYMRVFQNIDKFGFQGSFEGWIRRIMVNTAINHYRKNRMRSISDYMDEDTSEIEVSDKAVDVDNILGKFAVDDLMALVQNLPPVYKMVFNLYAIEGYSHKEIGDQLEISEATSRSNLAKARAKLQKQISGLKKNELRAYAESL